MGNICSICQTYGADGRTEGLCVACDIWRENLYDCGIKIEFDKSGHYKVTSFTYIDPNDDQENPIGSTTGNNEDIQRTINQIEQLRTGY